MIANTAPSLMFDTTILENGILAGRLKKYANPDLIDRETIIAWSNLTDN